MDEWFINIFSDLQKYFTYISLNLNIIMDGIYETQENDPYLGNVNQRSETDSNEVMNTLINTFELDQDFLEFVISQNPISNADLIRNVHSLSENSHENANMNSNPQAMCRSYSSGHIGQEIAMELNNVETNFNEIVQEKCPVISQNSVLPNYDQYRNFQVTQIYSSVPNNQNPIHDSRSEIRSYKGNLDNLDYIKDKTLNSTTVAGNTSYLSTKEFERMNAFPLRNQRKNQTEESILTSIQQENGIMVKINDILYMKDEQSRMENDIAAKSLSIHKTVYGDIQLLEMNRHYARFGQSVSKTAINGHLGHSVGFSDPQSNQHWMLRNTHALNTTHTASMQDGSSHNEIKKGNILENMLGDFSTTVKQKCQFNKSVSFRAVGEFEPKGIFQETPLQAETISNDDILAIAGYSKWLKSKYICPVCGKDFPSSSKLKRHLRVHSGENPFKCNICQKTFKEKGDLNVHMRIHLELKLITCNVCQKKFKQRSSLNYHIRVHLGHKPYKCKLCNKAFRQSSHLKTHALTHSGVKLFRCNICDCNFSLKPNLKRHMLTHSM